MIIFSSCITHWQSKVVAFKNKTNVDLVIATFYNDKINDSLLYYEPYTIDTLMRGKEATITLSNVVLKSEPDSSRLYLHVLDYKIMKEVWLIRK